VARVGEPSVVDLGIDGIVDAVRIGQGGFGTVYRAVQPAYRRTVAVKVLALPLVDDQVRAAFDKECQALGSLSSHPNIVTLHQAGTTEQRYPYLIMEYLAGGSLTTRVTSGPLPWSEAVVIGVKLAGALASAHAAGVLHRDVKPDNVLMSDYGEPQLVDFGVARLFGATRTATGAFSGSLTYAAPETLAGMSATEASDVWSLASTIATMIAGSPPFGSPTQISMQALITRILTAEPTDLRSFGTPEPVWAAIEAGLAKDSWARPAGGEAFGASLQDAQRLVGMAVTPMTVRNMQMTEPTPPTPATEPAPDATPTQARARHTETPGTSSPAPPGKAAEPARSRADSGTDATRRRRPGPLEEKVAGGSGSYLDEVPASPARPPLQDAKPPEARPARSGSPDGARGVKGPVGWVRSWSRARLLIGVAVIAAIIAIVSVMVAGGGRSTHARVATFGPAPTAARPSSTAPPETTTTRLASIAASGATQPGLDDYDGDGNPDPTCGTQDFGAGLVLRIPCQIINSRGPDSGTVMVKDSLLRLPGGVEGVDLPELESVSAAPIFSRDPAGLKIAVIFINSDALFDLGSSTLTDAANSTLAGIASAIKDHFPNAKVQVRGHTDATGAADANQRLSEARAASAKTFLVSQGLDPTSVTSVGLGSNEPLVEERNPNGSDNPEGRHTNRRVEIVVQAGAGRWG
jgi:serine/threonine protein kinase/outer membrane protein OmpA-like peptidoglycan-associated protein